MNNSRQIVVYFECFDSLLIIEPDIDTATNPWIVLEKWRGYKFIGFL